MSTRNVCRALRPAAAAAVAVAAAVAALSIGLLPLRLGADDLAFHEAGARAAALGGAFTARADDASALFYNPAGLAFLGGFRFKTNFAFGRRETTAEWPGTGPTFRTDPSQITGAHSLSWQPLKRVTVATGLFSPYDYESLWTPGWPGETACLRNRLRSLCFRSALAVEIVPGFAVSAGVDIVSSTLRWRHTIPFNIEAYPLARDVKVESRHTLRGNGWGLVAGALWKIVPAVQIGARFERSVTIDYAGENVFVRPMDITYATVPDPYREFRYVSDLIDFFYEDQDVTGRLTLPREVACGIAITPFSRLSLTLDVQWNRWSELGDWTFRSVNEGGSVNPAFTSEYQEFYGLSPDYGIQGQALGLRDTRSLKAGLEFRPRRFLALRAGFARHESSVGEAGRSPVYPDLDRNVYSLGFGYEGPLFSIWGGDEKVSDLSFDLFLRYASAAAGPSSLAGLEMTYGSRRLVAGVGVGFIF